MTWKRKNKNRKKKNQQKNRKVFKYKNPMIYDERADKRRL